MNLPIKPWMIFIVLPIFGLIAMFLTLQNTTDSVENTATAPTVYPSPQPFFLPTPTLGTITPTPTPFPAVINRPVAADLAWIDLASQPQTFEDFRGKRIILNFWATWCKPCQEEMPFLQEFYTSQDEFVVIAITDPNNAQTVEDVKKFVDDYHLTFPIGLDEQIYLHLAFNVPALPTTFFIDENGIVRHKFIGALTPETLQSEITYAFE